MSVANPAALPAAQGRNGRSILARRVRDIISGNGYRLTGVSANRTMNPCSRHLSPGPPMNDRTRKIMDHRTAVTG